MKTHMVVVVGMFLVLGGCSLPGAVQPGEKLVTRELTPDEKSAIATIVADSMKDPDSTRIKWMPVVLRRRDGITDYCGLVNARNSYGGYTGYSRFYGQLIADADGRFTRMVLRAVGTPDFDLETLCAAYGYVDFTVAHEERP